MSASPVAASAEDVASLNRVRNRLAASPDDQLPRILSSLLPKLLTRLDDYNEIPDDESAECKAIRLKAKSIVWGILDHALERLRGNSKLDIRIVMNALIPFIASQNVVIGTWALAYQQLFIQRIPPVVSSLPPTFMAELIRCIDHTNREQMQNPNDNSKRRLTKASWLFFDSIIMGCGLSPMIDWERDTFDGKEVRWKAQKSASWDALAPEKAIVAANNDGAGVFRLLLDLLLFWPTETPQSSGISMDSDERLRHRSIIPPEELHSINRQRHARRVVLHKWTDMAHLYLRHLKLCALRLAAWPSNQALFPAEKTDRALVLSVLLVSHNSMHGRLAADYVKGYDAANNIQRKDKIFRVSSVNCSVSVASSLLILIVGDRSARPVLESYQKSGRAELWEQILGPLPVPESIQRPRLPQSVAARAIHFLLHHPVDLPDRPEEAKRLAKLLIDLTLLLSHSGEIEHRDKEEIKQGKYWAVLLVKRLFGQLMASSLIDTNDKWTLQVFEKCLDASKEVLSVVVELGESRAKRQRTVNGQMPLGVPVPFNNRNDLNSLLHTHRETQQRKNLQMDEALQARQIAYELITSLTKNALSKETKPFELPIFLFKCVVHENVYLQKSVATALEAALEEYTKKLNFLGSDNNMVTGSTHVSSLREKAVPLLGCLLDAILSDSDAARSSAGRWISKLLLHMDAEAAYHLASYLVHDNDSNVAASAKAVLAAVSRPQEDASMDIAFFDFVDINDNAKKETIQRELRFRVEQVSRELRISTESAAVVLYDFKFSVNQVRDAHDADPHGIMEQSGVAAPGAMYCDKSDHYSQDRVCNICYEELGELEGKALGCKHEFCIACWTSFLEDAAGEGNMRFLDTRCPEHKCGTRVRLDDLRNIVPSLCRRWNDAYVDAFVQLDPAYRFCPGPDCNMVVNVPLADQRYQSITCERCDASFCFQCGEKPHQPATCSDYAEFGKIMGSSSLWIKKHAKPCPGCQAPIEKRDGCNHMTCEKCRQQFCWLCLTKLSRHSEDHACNQYDPVENAEDDYERHALFVSDRYQAHDDSEQFARDNRKKLRDHPDKLVEMFWFLTNADERIMQNALKTVIGARQVMKNSYIASFGLRRDPQKMKSLESHQGALELFTERLSQLTERNLHTLLAEKGQQRLIQHFQGLAFYTVSVSRYMHRFLNVCKKLHESPTTCA